LCPASWEEEACALTGSEEMQLGWSSQLRTAGGDLRLVLKAQQRRVRCRHNSHVLVKLDAVRRRATTYGNRGKGERGSELQPGAWSQAARRRTGRDHGDGWKWHGGATLGSDALAAKLRHGGTLASKGEHGGCGTYPETTTGFGQRGARTGEQLRTRVEVGELYAGACGRRVPPTMANGSMTPGDRVTDRWAPRVSDFQISEKLKNPFPLQNK
jgi:hypothetical protein